MERISNIVVMNPGAVAPAVVDRESLPWPDRARAIVITDGVSLQLAVDERAGAKALQDLAHERHDPICAKTHSAWTEATKQRKMDLEPPTEAIQILDAKILEWARKEQARAREAQRQIEAAQEKKILEEREAEIEHAEATGATAVEVQSIIEAPLPTLPPPPPAPKTKAVGAITKEAWKGEITDLWAFVKFAVENNRRELLALVCSDTVAVGSFARSIKSAGNIPGLKIWDAGQVASTPGRKG